MSKLKELKVYYQNICKKFVLPTDYEGVVNLVSSSFLLPRESILFNYLDEEGDKIGIVNQFDFEQVIKLYEMENASSIKINIEKSKSPETLSAITQSVLILNSQIEDDLMITNIKDDIGEFKNKLKSLINKDIDEKLDDVKKKIFHSLDMKLNILLSQFSHNSLGGNMNLNMNLNMRNDGIKRNKSCSNFKNVLVNKIREDKIINENIEKHYYKQFDKNSIFSSNTELLNINCAYKCKEEKSKKKDKNSILKDKEFSINSKICRICGRTINLDSSYYNCLHCEDVYFCNGCHTQRVSDHLLIQLRNPNKSEKTNKLDNKHLEWLHNLKKLKRMFDNKNKFLKDQHNFLSYNQENNLLIAFNNFTDKSVIEVCKEENDTNDFLNFKINFANFSKNDIKTNSYIECVFDQSDIFGNKIIFEEIVKGFEDFELNMMFYNFKNKPDGFYISKWRLVKNDGTNPELNLFYPNKNWSTLTFIFYLKSKSKEDIYSIDILTNKEKRANSFGAKNELVPALQNKERKFSNNYETVDKDRAGLKFPDMFSDIIKKHNEKKN